MIKLVANDEFLSHAFSCGKIIGYEQRSSTVFDCPFSIQEYREAWCCGLGFGRHRYVHERAKELLEQIRTHCPEILR